MKTGRPQVGSPVTKTKGSFAWEGPPKENSEIAAAKHRSFSSNENGRLRLGQEKEPHATHLLCLEIKAKTDSSILEKNLQTRNKSKAIGVQRKTS